MTVLEFIRRNSIIVIIAIAGVAVGLVMMDYGNQGSMFSRDFYVQVNGTGYNYPEAEALGGNGDYYLSQLSRSVHDRIRTAFDADGNEELDTAETEKAEAWLEANPQVDEALGLMNLAYQSWARGMARDREVNIAVTRALLREQAKELGIEPSKEQVDAFIRSFPAFVKEDGSFDQELYQRLAGYRKGTEDHNQERAFRSVVSDLIIWQSLRSMLTDGIRYDRRGTAAFIDVLNQEITGKTAWLPLAAAGEPAEPTEDELKAYWEQNKAKYMSEEKRIVSVYTLAPAEGSTLDALLSTTDIIMQDLSLANGRGFEDMLASAAENPELSPFTYLTPEGKSHVTLPLCALSALPEPLQAEVGEGQTLGAAAFAVESSACPSVQDYEAAVAAGKAESLVNIKQLRGFFSTKDGKLVLARVEAVERPVILSFEDARERALADLRQERKDNALALRAKEIYAAMEGCLGAEGGVTAAFDKAAEMGAEVSTFGPVGVGMDATTLPEGVDPSALMRTKSGQLAPLVVLPEGARISCVIERTVLDSPEMRAMRDMFLASRLNDQLELYLFTDWHSDAIGRYKVVLAKGIKLAGQPDDDVPVED